MNLEKDLPGAKGDSGKSSFNNWSRQQQEGARCSKVEVCLAARNDRILTPAGFKSGRGSQINGTKCEVSVGEARAVQTVLGAGAR